MHPHSLSTINTLHKRIANHSIGKKGVVVDIGCGIGRGIYKLSCLLPDDITAIGDDINAHAIDKANSSYSNNSKMEFYLETLEQFYSDHPNIVVHGIICVSTSMFLQNTKSFYQAAHKLLSDGGIFIDDPFVFKDTSKPLCEKFKNKTYNICGCKMQMHTTRYLNDFMKEAKFKTIKTSENDFELMHIKILLSDYSVYKLVSSFLRNIFIPPSPINANSSWYLFRRTLVILSYFMLNRGKYGAAAVIGVK